MDLLPVNKKEGLAPKSFDITSFENADFGLLLRSEEWSTIRDTRNGGWVQYSRVRYWDAEIQKVVVTSPAEGSVNIRAVKGSGRMLRWARRSLRPESTPSARAV